MRIFAVDLSSASGSLALREDDSLRADMRWNQGDVPHQHVFTLLPACFEQAGWTMGDVDHYVAGLGPGAFSGIRMSIATASGMALPGGKTAAGIPSAEALAWSVLAAEAGARVAVIGDARRNRVWTAVYTLEEGLPRRVEDFALTALDALEAQSFAGAVVLTPDWSRIGDALRARLGAAAEVIAEDRHPAAGALAELAARRLAAGRSLDPPLPIYMHPPVFVKPRFPKAS